ncbi:MAG TPA: hypothetical protein VNI02_06535 [Blastocatellia bacterium]|jgi:hypothetical protein|nr:hypothetical protein [Blastocatellia bacterium]
MNESERAQSVECDKGDRGVALTCKCPLCEQEISLELPDRRVPARWQGALAHRDKWADISAEFRAIRSVEGAARRLSVSEDEARFLLNFLCAEICGCRLVTCPSCLDDYRSEL